MPEIHLISGISWVGTAIVQRPARLRQPMAYQKIFVPFAESLLLSIFVIPAIRWVAGVVGLIDQPNHRKVHVQPTPLAGGISIAFVVAITLVFGAAIRLINTQDLTWIIGSVVMLFIGALDDRFNIKPVYRLIVQLACAAAVAGAGIRITSLYGFAGIYELPVAIQYIVTILVIAGVVNAYNLMDGIDGLLGSLTLVGSTTLGMISWSLNEYQLTVFFAVLSGAIIGFLRFNLGTKKIFMGDAGSLMLGFILVSTAIKLLTVPHAHDNVNQYQLPLVLAGLFLVPVFDSLRVYHARINRGLSPFHADKTHLHHLLLTMGASHKRATLMIVTLTVFILLSSVALVTVIPWWWVLAVAITLFSAATAMLTLNTRVS